MLASDGAPGSAKSPKKGILKNRGGGGGVGFSMEEPSHETVSPRASSANYEKAARWDEMNILQTYHPPDKDYGHMKIDEPKTPYNYGTEEAAAAGLTGGVDADEIHRRLNAEQKMALATSRLHGSHVSLSSEDDGEEVELTPEAQAHREQFEERRKKHYNEGHLLRDAKRMVEQELEQLEQGDSSTTQSASVAHDEPMEDDDQMMNDADEMYDGDEDEGMDRQHQPQPQQQQQQQRHHLYQPSSNAPRSKVTSSYQGPSPPGTSV